MDTPQATQPSEPTAQVLPEAEFIRLVSGALIAHVGPDGRSGLEAALTEALKRINPGNGSSIIGPGGSPVRLNTPSAQELSLMCLQALRVSLQTQRITLVVLNDLDTRLRLQAAQQASTGSVERADTPGKPIPRTTGKGSAETQGASTGE